MCSIAPTRHTLARVLSLRGWAQQLCTKEVPQLWPCIRRRWSRQRLVARSPRLPHPILRPRSKPRRSGSSPNPSRFDLRPLRITVRSTMVPRSSARWALQQCSVRYMRGLTRRGRCMHLAGLIGLHRRSSPSDLASQVPPRHHLQLRRDHRSPRVPTGLYHRYGNRRGRKPSHAGKLVSACTESAG
jgi:hypothetical protein